MPRRLLVLLALLLPLPAMAADTAGRDLAASLLSVTGTAAVFAAPAVQAALADPHPFAGEPGRARRERLVGEAGFRAWVPPRAWVLEARREGESEHWGLVAPALAARAEARGYRFVGGTPDAESESLLSRLVPGQPAPGLEALLALAGADALVLVRGREWALWSPSLALRGSLGQPALLPELVAEALATAQQWPAAGGRSVLQVEGVTGMADLAALRASLQAIPGFKGMQLLRATSGCVWFVVPLDPAALAAALEAEPRLAVQAPPGSLPGQPAATLQAVRLLSPLVIRRWQPAVAPPAADSLLQSPVP